MERKRDFQRLSVHGHRRLVKSPLAKEATALRSARAAFEEAIRVAHNAGAR